jgi:hypothetical protein
VGASTSAGWRSTLRRWWGPTSAPPNWALVGHLATGLVLGIVVAGLIEPRRGGILAGLSAAIVAGAGSSGPPRVALRLAGLVAVAGLLATWAAFLSVGHPVWAAVGMAIVAVLTSLAVGTGPAGAAVGVLGSFVYALTLTLATTAELHDVVSELSGLGRIVIGCVLGLVIVGVSVWRRARADPEDAAIPPPEAPWRRMLRSLRTFDAYARDGVRRAIPLAIGVYFFERSGSRDAAWIFMAAFAVLLPSGKAPVEVALVRALSTVVAVMGLGLLALVVPARLLFAAAAAFLLIGLAYSGRYPLAGSGLMSIAAILFVAAPRGEFADWASRRLVDTLIGCGLAVAATALLWPADPAPGPTPLLE